MNKTQMKRVTLPLEVLPSLETYDSGVTGLVTDRVP